MKILKVTLALSVSYVFAASDMEKMDMHKMKNMDMHSMDKMKKMDMQNGDMAFKMNEKLELIRPKNYRTWVYIGTPVTPNDLNGGHAAFPEMHNVYIDPKSYEVYKKTGKFRDGTVIVKELVSVGAKSAVSGKGYFEGEFLGLEASVKSKKYFPNEPGNWAIFSFSNMKTGMLKNSAKAMPVDKCVACHQASAADDFVFTQYYPVLRAAKGFGDKNPENMAKRTLLKMMKK